MPDFKNIANKHGWHPQEKGTKLKGQVNGLLHRNKDQVDYSTHVSRPLSELRDPASFGPPPKRDPNVLPPPLPPSRSSSTAVGASQGSTWQQQDDTPESPPAQRKPWALDTTGLSTANLPPPPGRRDGADGRPVVSSPPYSPTGAAGPRAGVPPSLPPRLPPRTSSSPSGPTSPRTQPELLNQGAVNRLGQAGISVSGLGIGKSSTPPRLAGRTPSNSSSSQLDDLSNRFSHLGGRPSSSSPPPSEGTTFAQKQAALRTASNFHKDPSSVSFSDARAAASTANNFRQRHGDQVASGLQTANRIGQRFGGSAGGVDGEAPGNRSSQNSGTTSSIGALAKKKPPPPPPPKKWIGLGEVTGSGAHRGGGNSDAPPPVPFGTRPQF